MNSDSSLAQLIWGIALILAGLGVLYRIPQVMPKIMTIEQFSSAGWIVRVCFYVMAIILIGGGTKKLIQFFQLKKSENNSKK